MTNFFDKFDDDTSPKNFFDKFDTEAPGSQKETGPFLVSGAPDDAPRPQSRPTATGFDAALSLDAPVQDPPRREPVSARNPRDIRGPGRADEDPGQSVADLGSRFARGATEIAASVPEAAAIAGFGNPNTSALFAEEEVARAREQIEMAEQRLAEFPDMPENERVNIQAIIAAEQRKVDAYEPLIATATGPTKPDARDRALFKRGDQLRAASAELFGTPDAEFDDRFVSKLAEGAGSMAGFVAAALATGVVGGAGFGAAANSSQMYREAIAEGASEDQAKTAAFLGSMVGASEVIPIGRALDILPAEGRKRFTNALSKRLANAFLTAGEEGAQEALAQIANNMIAQGVWDSERGTFDGATEAALIGAVLGGGLGAVGPVGRDRERIESPRLTDADRASPLPNDLIDDGKAILEQVAKGRDISPLPPTEVTTPPAVASEEDTGLGSSRIAPAGPVSQGTDSAIPSPGTPPEVEAQDRAPEQPEEPEDEVLPVIEADGTETGEFVRINRSTGRIEKVQPDEAPQVDASPAPGRQQTRPEASEATEETAQTNDPRTDQTAPAEAAAFEDPETDNQDAAASANGAPAPRAVEVLTNDSLGGVTTDAETFQYKGGGDQDGVTDRLRDVTKWDDNRTGLGLVYEYEDGRRVIVDGHQRFGLARRLAAEGQQITLPVRVLREADGISEAEARAIGAAKNIAEGSGSSIDAAKIFRDTRMTAKEFDLPLSSTMVRNADGIAKLSDDAFGMVNNEIASERDGALVGSLVQDQKRHADILGLLAKLKPSNTVQAESIIRQASQAEITETQQSLFGEEEVSNNLYLERAKVLDRAIKSLGNEIQTFRTLVDRADTISEAGNVLEGDANAARLAADQAAKSTLTKQANTKGPISDALTQAARQYRENGKLADAARAFVDAVRGTEGEGQSRGPEASPSGDGDGSPEAGGQTGGSREAVTTASEAEAPATERTGAGNQTVIPGAEQSAERSAAAREADQRRELEARQQQSKKRSTAPQGDAGPLFNTQGDLLDAASPAQTTSSPSKARKRLTDILRREWEAREDLPEGADEDFLKRTEAVRAARKALADEFGDAAANEALEQIEDAYRAGEAGQPASGGDERTLAPSEKIEDFGEKIGGAQKDKVKGWLSRAAEVADSEIPSVPLSKSWPEPDYDALIEEGADPTAVAFIHAARDEVPVKPRQGFKLDRWAKQVRLLREFSTRLIQGTVTMDDVRNRVGTGLNGFIGRVALYERYGHEKSLKGVSLRAGSYSVFKGERFSPAKTIWVAQIKRSMVADGNSQSEAVEAFAPVWEELGGDDARGKGVKFEIRKWRTGNVFIGKKVGRDWIELASDSEWDWAAARKYLAENQAELEAEFARKKALPPERGETNSPRVGIDHRNGQDVSPNMFSEAFGFRGVQFGNYVEGPRRQQDLNEAYDGLMDLAGVIGVPPKALSLNGELGLAFGARGSGRKAAAHYEPGQVVINLTKGQGAGSLAHEWWHGMDHYFARQGGKSALLLTETRTNTLGDGIRPELVAAFDGLMNLIRKGELKVRSSMADKRKSKPYFSTMPEMTARAFESYVIGKLNDQSTSNDYLANILSEEAWTAIDQAAGYSKSSWPYVRASEMPEFREAFDTLFDTIQTEKTAKGVRMYQRDPAPQAVADVAADALGEWENMRELGRRAQAWYRDNLSGKTIVNEQTGWEIYMSTVGAKKVGGRKGDVLFRAVVALPEMIAKGRLVSSTSDARGRPDIVAVHKFAATVNVDGRPRDLIVTVREDRKKKFHYDISRDNGDGARFRRAALNAERRDESQVRRTAVDGSPVGLNIEFSEPSRNRRVAQGKLRDLMPALERRLDELMIRGVDLSLSSDANFQGATEISADGDIAILIGATLDGMETLNHEAIHVLRARGLFTAREWSALSEKAQRTWLDRFDIQERYPDLDAEGQIEEAIAEAFADFASGRAAQGRVKAIFTKVKRFFRALKEALAGQGIRNTEAIFEAVEQGEVGARTRASTKSPAFKRWFGDSKAVEENGEPLTLYHGTRPAFDAFAVTPQSGRRTEEADARKGFFFTDNMSVASSYIGADYSPNAALRIMSGKDAPRIEEVHLSIQNPFEFNMRGGFYSEQEFSDIIDAAKDEGHDGVVIRNVKDGYSEEADVPSDVWIAFRPEQVKSVFNEGTFDPQDARIKFQRRKQKTGPHPAQNLFANGAAPFLPDRRVWDELFASNRGIWQNIGGASSALHDRIDKARTKIQDRFLPVLRGQQAIEKAIGQPLPEELNAYLAEETFAGKVGRHLFEIDEDFAKPIIDLIAATGGDLSVDDVGRWLTARHAKERNAYIATINDKMPDGGSGMKNAEADQILTATSKGKHAATLSEIGALIDRLRDRTIDLRVDAGLMTARDAAVWKAQYKAYVPLKGFAETDAYDEEMMGQGVGKRYSVTGQETKRALGRSSEAFNPLQAAITQAQEAAIRAEKNRVAKTMFDLASQHSSPNLWEIRDVETKRFYNKTTGRVEEMAVGPASQRLMPNEMAVKINGKERRIVFNDPRIAEAAGTIGADQMGPVVKVLSMASRYFSAVNTMLDPEFVVRNAFRDMTTAQINMRNFGEGDRNKIAKAMVKNWPKAWLAVYRGQQNKADTEWTRWFKEFEESGGKVSFWVMDQPEAGKADLERRVGLATGNRAARIAKVISSPSALFSTRDNWMLGKIEQVNLSVDNAVRLAAYVEARRSGWSKARAASLSKNLTVNFNRRGTWGANLNAAYPFFNAAMQGSQVLVRAMSSKRMAKYVAALVAYGVFEDIVNSMISEEDDDGELAYDKIPDWKLEMNLIWMRTEGNAVTVPLPYGYNVFPYLGKQIGKVMRGVKEPGEAFGDVVGAVFGAFSPIAADQSDNTGLNAVKFLSPMATDTLIELASNRDWLDRPIRPESPYNDFGPDAYKFYGGATDAAKSVADFLNRISGGNRAEEGFLDISPEYIDHVTGFLAGGAGRFLGRSSDVASKLLTGDLDLIEDYKVPFARSMRTTTGTWLDRDRFYAFREEVNEALEAVKVEEETGDPASAESRKLVTLNGALKIADKQMRKIRNEKKSAGARVTPAQRKDWEAREAMIVLTFNRKYLDLMGPQAE